MINNNVYKPKAGLSVLEILGVNVSNDQYLQLTGRELPYELNYEKSQYGTMPIRFLTNGPAGYVDISFNVSNEERQSGSTSGKMEFINERCQTWWSDSKDGSTGPEYIDFEIPRRRTLQGESKYINFLIQMFRAYTGEGSDILTNYDNGQKFNEIDLNYSAQSLFDGTFNLQEYFNSIDSNPTVIGVYTIKDTGEKLRQRINTEVFYSGSEITDKIKGWATKKIEAGLYGEDYTSVELVEGIEKCRENSTPPAELPF